MNLYSFEVKICATAYIKAESDEEALSIAMANFGENMGGELPIGESDIEVSGRSYDDPDLPDVSLSPAVTFYGAFDGEPSVSFVERNIDASETEEADV